jgi:hypothetical protein
MTGIDSLCEPSELASSGSDDWQPSASESEENDPGKLL